MPTCQKPEKRCGATPPAARDHCSRRGGLVSFAVGALVAQPAVEPLASKQAMKQREKKALRTV
jgi:hypothetical protein